MSDASDAVVVVRRAPWSGAGFLIAAAMCVATCGCRTSSWTSPSSWSMFGSQPKADDKLAATPTGTPGDITKPSATAQPYPTTSTPEAYSLAAGASSPAGQPVAQPARPTEPGPIVYGSTPAPSSDTAARGTSPPAYGGAPPMSAIAPQVGPYASSGAAPPAGFAAGPPPATPEAVPYASSSSPPARFAENPPPRAGLEAGMQPPAGSGGAAEAVPSGSRYATGGSRFASGGPMGAAPVSEPSASTWAAPPAMAGPPTPSGPPPASATNSGFQPLLAPPPGGVPAAPAAAPPATPAPSAWEPLPSSPPPAPPAPAASSAPQRRPDPGYRPGSTSSYRPGSDMITGERAVQPVSFSSAPPPLVPPPRSQ
jgi:hypothetical protein